jgi:hypothetical protein
MFDDRPEVLVYEADGALQVFAADFLVHHEQLGNGMRLRQPHDRENVSGEDVNASIPQRLLEAAHHAVSVEHRGPSHVEHDQLKRPVLAVDGTREELAMMRSRRRGHTGHLGSVIPTMEPSYATHGGTTVRTGHAHTSLRHDTACAQGRKAVRRHRDRVVTAAQTSCGADVSRPRAHHRT